MDNQTAETVFEIRRYTAEDSLRWNAFVRQAKNATFLFHRSYMDYHSDRFTDHSLMILRKGELYALLPGNADGDVFYSHQGLTYGGLITDANATAADTIVIFRMINDYLRNNGFKKVIYKAIPWIYHIIPAEEDIYAIFRVCNARLAARDISSTINMRRRPKWNRDRRYGAKRCLKNGVCVQQSNDYEGLWKVLDANLMSTYGVHPVHSIDEIRLLKSRFPSNIVLYTATLNGEVLGGTVLFLTPQVVHAQYISASAEGKHLRVIDAIYDCILNYDFVDAQYFDFGKSTEEHGSILNESLIYQKEGFGGRGVCYDWYQWDL